MIANLIWCCCSLWRVPYCTDNGGCCSFLGVLASSSARLSSSLPSDGVPSFVYASVASLLLHMPFSFSPIHLLPSFEPLSFSAAPLFSFLILLIP